MRTIQQQLKEKGLSEGAGTTEAFPKNKASFKSKENLSRKEWEELMGLNRPTYQKQGGTVRRKR
ncbi:hypothetical protein [Planococcus wigleyi]|uniref:Uncharacterized protein n=1 Tax=Planococcus wigleyi TaxID=2762216 RepID=A0ABR8WA21_9BACL|nr:hypothetical protein [Planococcus wigleyi]MBD8013875.1 hypothetical protein [Planococcus wigleyi]